MPGPLNSETVAQRLLNFPRDNFLYIGSFMKSVVLAAGTIVLLDIVVEFRGSWPRLMPWLTSLLAAMVTHTTWGRGIILTNSRGNLWDEVFPLLMGIVEFCLFAILSPRASDPNLWRWWLIIIGLHALLAVGLVNNRIANTRLQDDFAADLQHLANEYLTWNRTDGQEAAKGAALAFILGSFALVMLPRWLDGVGYVLVYWVLVLPFVLIFSYVIWRSDQQRQQIDRAVFPEQNSGAEAAG